MAEGRTRARQERDEAGRPPPLKSYRRILDEELALADAELARPAGAMATSGLLAGLGVCLSVYLIAVLDGAGAGTPDLLRRFLVGNAYAAGFLVVIFARADLFTEYTTITLLPVMFGRSRPAALARLWGIVYVANLVGAAAGALFLVQLGADHAPFAPAVFGGLAAELAHGSSRGLILGAVLAGWLMGLLSWLIVAARETISQVVFVWVIGVAIGFGQLPHSITGSAEVIAAALAGTGIGILEVGRFLLLSTIGNALGSLLFAALIRYAVARQEIAGS